MLYGHTADSWVCNSGIDCVYTVNWTTGDSVSTNSVIGITAPFFNGGTAQPHLHLGVFKPYKACKNGFCEPPSKCWGYGDLIPNTGEGEFIDPEEFFTNPAYKLKP